MSNYEVAEPILNSPFAEPKLHRFIQSGQTPQQREGRRAAIVFPPRNQVVPWQPTATLQSSEDYVGGFELALVRLVRERVKAWQAAGYPGVTRTTAELLAYWRRDGRERRLFFAQIEAVEAVIFLTEARADFRQGIEIPRDEPSDDRKADGFSGFLRYACKMATGSGKSTVMGMVAAWSILSKVNNRSDERLSVAVEFSSSLTRPKGAVNLNKNSIRDYHEDSKELPPCHVGEAECLRSTMLRGWFHWDGF